MSSLARFAGLASLLLALPIVVAVRASDTGDSAPTDVAAGTPGTGTADPCADASSAWMQINRERAAALITAASHGESDPAVPTADDVDEPRNRRVEVTVR